MVQRTTISYYFQISNRSFYDTGIYAENLKTKLLIYMYCSSQFLRLLIGKNHLFVANHESPFVFYQANENLTLK